MDKTIYRFKALTDLWTGAVDGKSDRLITTGLLGSIRWWFEALVRGLGCCACDPTNTRCEGRNHCVVCELFGCTGWARKFRFDVLDENGKIKKEQILKGDSFQLRFVVFRPIRIEEWTLLVATLRLIAEYGAIGGKTVFKPTDESSRADKPHHKDYGLVKMTLPQQFNGTSRGNLKTYLSRWRKLNHGEFSWASLKNFWFVDKKTLSREETSQSTFNKVLGRKESKACRDCGQIHNPTQKCPKTERPPKRYSEHLINRNDTISNWLAGSRGKSKKVFSFKNPARTFGFVKPDLIDFNAMNNRLKSVWGKDGWEFLTGDDVIKKYFPKKEK